MYQLSETLYAIFIERPNCEKSEIESNCWNVWDILIKFCVRIDIDKI